MIEDIIAIGIVLAAVGFLVYTLFRTATGKSRCAGCRGCADMKTTCNTRPPESPQNEKPKC